MAVYAWQSLRLLHNVMDRAIAWHYRGAVCHSPFQEHGNDGLFGKRSRCATAIRFVVVEEGACVTIEERLIALIE